jgi:hypothetical protein
MQMYCTFVLFVNQHFPGLPSSGTITATELHGIYERGDRKRSRGDIHFSFSNLVTLIAVRMAQVGE